MSKENRRVLIIATVVKTHIMQFHIPTLKLFKDMGWETAVAARNDYANPEDCNIPYCDTFYDIPFQREPFRYENLQCYHKLKKIIDEGDFAIVHCHTPVGGVLGRLAARSARKNGTRVLYTAHGFHFYRGAPLKNWLLYYPVEKLLVRYTDSLITINREDFEFAQRRMKMEQDGKVFYVPGVGVDLEKFPKSSIRKTAKRKELGIPENAVVLLSVGELNANKNHETMVRAVARMDVYYLIAGRGEFQKQLQDLIDTLGVRDRVKLLGYRNDVKELHGVADIFVFPSFREGLPLSVMEAMAAGVPVIASRIRGNVDLIEDGVNGFLCDPDDAKGFAEQIEKLLDDPELAERFRANSLAKIKYFDERIVMEQLFSIYRETAPCEI